MTLMKEIVGRGGSSVTDHND